MNTENTKPKSKTLAFFLSALPGVGHMYLGLLRQGTQFMLLFLSLIFIINLLSIEAIGIFLPIVWFSSLFDCLKKVAMPELPEDEDISFIKWLKRDMNFTTDKTKYIGYGLIIVGAYLLIDKAIIPQFEDIFSYRVRSLLRTGFVSLLLIAGGVKLLLMSKNSVTKNDVSKKGLEE